MLINKYQSSPNKEVFSLALKLSVVIYEVFVSRPVINVMFIFKCM